MSVRDSRQKSDKNPTLAILLFPLLPVLITSIIVVLWYFSEWSLWGVTQEVHIRVNSSFKIIEDSRDKRVIAMSRSVEIYGTIVGLVLLLPLAFFVLNGLFQAGLGFEFVAILYLFHALLILPVILLCNLWFLIRNPKIVMVWDKPNDVFILQYPHKPSITYGISSMKMTPLQGNPQNQKFVITSDSNPKLTFGYTVDLLHKPKDADRLRTIFDYFQQCDIPMEEQSTTPSRDNS